MMFPPRLTHALARRLLLTGLGVWTAAATPNALAHDSHTGYSQRYQTRTYFTVEPGYRQHPNERLRHFDDYGHSEYDRGSRYRDDHYRADHYHDSHRDSHRDNYRRDDYHGRSDPYQSGGYHRYGNGDTARKRSYLSNPYHPNGAGTVYRDAPQRTEQRPYRSGDQPRYRQ